MFLSQVAGQPDHRRVVRRNGGVVPGGEQGLEHPCKGGVDVRLVLPGNAFRLAVRALDEADADPERVQPFQIALTAQQRRLQHGADLMVAVMPQRLDDLERRLGVRGALHVDTDEEPGRLGAFEDLAHVVDGRRGIDIEPELGELERHVPLDAGLDHGVEQLDVLPRGGVGGFHGRDALPQQVEREQDMPLLEPLRRGDRLVDRFARDEAAGEAAAAAHAVL